MYLIRFEFPLYKFQFLLYCKDVYSIKECNVANYTSVGI